MPISITRGIFSSEWKAWAAVVAYTVLLYGTLTVLYDLYSAVYGRLGEIEMSQLINRGFFVAGLALLGFIVLGLPRNVRSYLVFGLICLTVAACLQVITTPAKRLHLFQYGPLTLLVFDAVRFRAATRFRYIWTIVIVSVIGLGDETLQWILPNRYFGIPDLLTNAAAGVLTLVFIVFVLGEENYPYPRAETVRGDKLGAMG